MTLDVWPVGLLTALVTPLADDALDVDALGAIIDRQVDAGIAGLVIGGGTGEYAVLTTAERQQLAAEAVRLTARRIPVIVQTGALATRDAIALSRHAESVGADAIMVASPFGEPINWRERLHFYEVLTAAVGLPVMIYNTPPSGLLTFDQIRQLAQLPNVSAVKDSSGSPELMGDLVAWADADFGVYVGLDSLLFDAVGTGARGAVFGAANLIPEPLAAVARSVREQGATPDARSLWRDHLRPFLRFVEQSQNYIALCKAGMAAVGFPVGPAREPYLAPERDEVDELARRLDDVAAAFTASPLSAVAAGAAG